MILFSEDELGRMLLPFNVGYSKRERVYAREGVKADPACLETGSGRRFVQRGDSERCNSTRRVNRREQGRAAAWRRHSAGARGADRVGTSGVRAEDSL